MTPLGTVPGVTDARWLGWLCANFDILRRIDAAEADRLLAAARAGRDESVRLAQLARELDLPPDDDARRAPDHGTTLPGVTALVVGRISQEVLVCPGDRCGRTAVRRSGVPVPVCPVVGERMRLVRA